MSAEIKKTANQRPNRKEIKNCERKAKMSKKKKNRKRQKNGETKNSSKMSSNDIFFFIFLTVFKLNIVYDFHLDFRLVERLD